MGHGTWDNGTSCSIISRVCGAKVHALFSITQLFVRLFVRDNVCSHAEAQRAQSSHRELCFPLIMIFLPALMAEIFPLFRYFSVSSVIDKDNSHGDWRKDFFITEETEIIGK